MNIPPIVIWVLRRLLRRVVRRRFGRKPWTACTLEERTTVAVEIVAGLRRELDRACRE